MGQTPVHSEIASTRSTFSSVSIGTVILWVCAASVALLALSPILYLMIRALEADANAWSAAVQARTFQYAVTTLGLAAGVTFTSILIALPLAWLTTRTDLPARRIWTVAAAAPLAIPSYVGAYLFIAALGPRGMLQQWLAPLGVTRLPDFYGFWGALIVLTLLSYPYALLPLRAAILRIDPAYEEASWSLGRSRWSTFWRVILPQMRPAMFAGGLLVTLYVLRDFGAVALLRCDTFTRIIYLQYQSTFDRTTAAIYSLLLVGMTLAILAVELRWRGRAREYVNVTGVNRERRVIESGPWKWPALLYCGTVTAVSLLLPAGVLAYWLMRGLLAGESLRPVFGAVWNSVISSMAAAVVACALALPVIYLSVRKPGWISLSFDRIAYSSFALPGVVAALALAFFSVRYLPELYQTWPLLIIAYVILFLPQAMGPARASLEQIHPSLEEAARSLGSGALRTLWTVTTPLLRPGLLSGAGLVFLTTMKELPATLILSPYDFHTLATLVWSAVLEAFFARAAAPALLLVLVSSVSLALMLRNED